MYKNQITKNHLVEISNIVKKYNALNKKELKSFLYGSSVTKSFANYRLHFNTDKHAATPLITIKLIKSIIAEFTTK